MNRLPLDRRFRQALVLALAASGCKKAPATPDATPPVVDAGTDTPENGLPTGPFPTPDPDCDPTLFAQDSLAPAIGVAGIVLKQVTTGMMQGNTQIIAQSGELCPGVAELCSESMKAASDSEPLRRDCGQVGCTETRLLYADDSSVSAITTTDGLIDFLGAIDTAAEARLLVWASGFDVACEATAEGAVYTMQATEHISDCPIQIDTVQLTVAADGVITELSRTEGISGACVGRLPPGLTGSPGCVQSVGDWLAEAAYTEAASVHAFRVLAWELAHHGAPAALVAAAVHAADDEVRHARIMAGLAAKHGAQVRPVHVLTTEVRSLADIARDNASEGLGREAWGAVLALWQAEHAADPDVRDAMQHIALDEVRHAELSRALHEWLHTQLSAVDNATVLDSWQRAWRAVPTCDDPVIQRVLGLPASPEPLLAALRQVGIAGA